MTPRMRAGNEIFTMKLSSAGKVQCLGVEGRILNTALPDLGTCFGGA
jgi:hypothetical protein